MRRTVTAYHLRRPEVVLYRAESLHITCPPRAAIAAKLLVFKDLQRIGGFRPRLLCCANAQHNIYCRPWLRGLPKMFCALIITL